MPANQAVLDFVERCQNAANADAVRDMLFSELAALGYAYVACCSHVDPLRPPLGAVAMINYPPAWLARFSERKYALLDPVFKNARTAIMPFFWRELAQTHNLSPAQRAILKEAASFGLADGVTIPIQHKGALPASCSLVPGPDGVDPLNMPGLFMLAHSAHEAARRRAGGLVKVPSLLSPRERECLTLAGRGKSDWVIGEILSLNSRTVHNTLERAKKRFGVSSRIQAVVQAVFEGQIALDDLSDD